MCLGVSGSKMVAFDGVGWKLGFVRIYARIPEENIVRRCSRQRLRRCQFRPLRFHLQLRLHEACLGIELEVNWVTE